MFNVDYLILRQNFSTSYTICVFVLQYKTHYIKGKDGLNLPFVFNDIMGLEREDSCGVHIQDLLKAINGLLREGYKVRTTYHIHEMRQTIPSNMLKLRDHASICYTSMNIK